MKPSNADGASSTLSRLVDAQASDAILSPRAPKPTHTSRRPSPEFAEAQLFQIWLVAIDPQPLNHTIRETTSLGTFWSALGLGCEQVK